MFGNYSLISILVVVHKTFSVIFFSRKSEIQTQNRDNDYKRLCCSVTDNADSQTKGFLRFKLELKRNSPSEMLYFAFSCNSTLLFIREKGAWKKRERKSRFSFNISSF